MNATHCLLCGAKVRRYANGIAVRHNMPLSFLKLTGKQAKGADRRCPASLHEGHFGQQDILPAEAIEWRWDYPCQVVVGDELLMDSDSIAKPMGDGSLSYEEVLKAYPKLEILKDKDGKETGELVLERKPFEATGTQLEERLASFKWLPDQIRERVREEADEARFLREQVEAARWSAA